MNSVRAGYDQVVTRRGPLADGQVFEWWKQYGRHEALRTLIELDAKGAPRQVVHPPDKPELRFDQVDAGIRRDDERVLDLLWRARFDVEDDWPVRVCLFVTDTGGVHGLAMVFSHVVIDAIGAEVVRRELAELLLTRWSGEAHRLRPVDRQLLDAVEMEADELLQPERAAAEEHWRRQLRAMPNRVSAGSHHTAFELYSGTLSAATAPATMAVAAQRYRTTADVLYTASVLPLLGALSGRDRTFVRTHYHGRTPELAQVVGCFHRILPVTVDLSEEPPLSEVVRRVAAETLRARRQYRLEWTRMKELEALEMARRGAGFAWGSTINHSLQDDYEESYLRPDRYSRQAIAEPGPTVKLVPNGIQRGDWGVDAYLLVRLGTAEMTVEAGFDGDTLGPPAMRALLCGPEQLLFDGLTAGDLSFAAVRRYVQRCGAVAAAPAETADSCLVDLDHLGDVLSQHPAVLTAKVSLAHTAACDQLSASVTARDRRTQRPAGGQRIRQLPGGGRPATRRSGPAPALGYARLHRAAPRRLRTAGPAVVPGEPAEVRRRRSNG